MKVLFVYPAFHRHADDHPELREHVPMNEYLGSPSLGIASMIAHTPGTWEIAYRDDRLEPADGETDAHIVALSFFTPAATRALQLADHFRAQGHTVVAGGIFPTAMPDVVARHVDAIVVGEGEILWPRLLHDFVRGQLRPRYENDGTVDLNQVGIPDLSYYFASERAEFQPDDYPLQISRGCPLTCEACILPKSMTRTLRTLPLDHCIGQLEQLVAAGKQACLTEDTSWFPSGRGQRRLFDLLDYVLDRGMEAPISYIGTSMAMIRATPLERLERARAAGVSMFYLVGGFDPVTRRAFTGTDPIALDYAFEAIARCHDAGIEPYTSFLIGNDADDRGTPDRMLEFANKAGIRKAEFAIATPYPGTPRWDKLVAQDRIRSRHWAHYNDANVVFEPSQMTMDELERAYVYLWREFYSTRSHLADLPLAERTIQF